MTTNTLLRRMGTVALVLAVAVLAVACTDTPERSVRSGSGPTTSASPPARTYVGTVDGTDALVAVVSDGSRVLAYVCDGVPGDPVGSAPALQAWFNGALDGDAVEVAQGGNHLRLRLGEQDVAGELALADGRTLALAGRLVDGEAGLYRAEPGGGEDAAVAGWILAADGTQRGGLLAGTTLSGTTLLDTSQLTFSFQSLATARIARVGITPIPIP